MVSLRVCDVHGKDRAGPVGHTLSKKRRLGKRSQIRFAELHKFNPETRAPHVPRSTCRPQTARIGSVSLTPGPWQPEINVIDRTNPNIKRAEVTNGKGDTYQVLQGVAFKLGLPPGEPLVKDYCWTYRMYMLPELRQYYMTVELYICTTRVYLPPTT